MNAKLASACITYASYFSFFDKCDGYFDDFIKYLENIMRRYIVLRFKNIEKRSAHYLDIQSFSDLKGAPKISMEFLSGRAIDDMKRDPEVQAIALVMPTYLIKPFFLGNSEIAKSWGVDAVQATNSKYTGEGAKIAVLDTGIDKEHPAFLGMKLIENDFSGNGNGDHVGHGTHCAGTIFGRDVGQRIGVARGVKEAWIGKVFGDDGRGKSDMIFKAIHWALEQRVDIISMSLGFDFPGMVTQLVEEGLPTEMASSIALEAYGANLRLFDATMALLKFQSPFGASPLVVAAAGNESRRKVNKDYRIITSLPAAAVDVISVAAAQRVGVKYSVADFSNTLATVIGPGVDITSAWPGGGLRTLSGTSMACPHVAGVAALWSEYLKREGLNSDAKNLTARLISNARKDFFVEGTINADIGQGLITAPQ